MVARSPLIIEVCVDSVESAITAIQAGADRLEVCANLGVGGGTTPSLGLLKSIQRAVEDVPIMAMVRPRTGDFLYSGKEVKVMLEDIRILKDQNIRGVVIGALTCDGRIDVGRMRQFVDETLPLEVCFHRAFDMTRNATEALQTIIEIGGIARILTSGQGKTALEALSQLEALYQTTKSLIEEGVWGLTIMPGSGVNPKSITPILSSLLPHGLREVHLSGGKWEQGGMVFMREGMGMGSGGQGDWGVWRTQGETIREVRVIADNLWQEFAKGSAENSK